MNGKAIVPTAVSGRNLSFDLSALGVGVDDRLTYSVLIGIGTKLGKNTNFAQSTSGVTLSNQASAEVGAEGGMFDDKGTILGGVWIRD